MEKGLYDSFAERWYRGGSIWLYSDPHFSDPEMQYIRRNYIGDDEQIKRINSCIGKKDTLIILGDIGDVNQVKKLRGYKVLIMGNHDSGASNYKSFFDEVYEGPLWIADRLLLSHEPISLPFALNIHGHDHSGIERQPNCFNVCAENINYKPVCLKHILASDLRKNIDSIHRITIDNATERSKKKAKNSKN